MNCEFSSVISIGDWCFNGCASLSKLPTSKALSSIGSYAYNGCRGLNQDLITYLNNSVIISIGNSCFNNCTSLFGSITNVIKNKNAREIQCGSAWFFGTKVQKSSIFSLEGKTQIAAHEFDGTTILKDNSGNLVTEIIIPETITSIGDGAFANIPQLQKVTINARVTTMGDRVFAQCANLKEVTLPPTLQILPEGTFTGCTLINKINIPESLIEIKTYAFNGVTFDTFDFSHVKTVQNQAFNGCHFKKVTWGNSLTNLYGTAFWITTFDEKVSVPASVSSLSGNAFCSSNMPECEFLCDLSVVPDGLFESSTVQKVTFTHPVTKIGSRAFQGCSKLTSIVMPEETGWSSVTSIGDNAFNGCTSWRETIELGNCTWNKENSFFNCPVIITKKQYQEGVSE